MRRSPGALARAFVAAAIVTLVPGLIFGFGSLVLAVGGFVFVAGVIYGLDRPDEMERARGAGPEAPAP